jgi:PhnB protein
MTAKVKPLPEGSHTVTPRIYVRGVAKAVEFYKQAFGATELGRFADPSGKTVNAEIKIGDSMLSLSEESPEWRNYSPQSLGGATTIIILNVEDADLVWDQALAAGAKEIFPLEDQFYGYRQGRVEDPFGHFWIISTRIEDTSLDR